MTDLQGALIVLGVLAVAAVAIYNYWQERQFRRKSEKVLPAADRDVLLPEAPAEGMPAPGPEPSDDVPSDPDGSSRREPSLGERTVADGRVEPRLVGPLNPGAREASEVPSHAMPVHDTPATAGLERPSVRRP
jgi:hypothetical protein